MPSGLAMDETNSMALIVALIVIAILQGNGMFGKQGPMTSVGGVITSGFALTVVLYGIVAVL